ncbi:MAG: hypothetical protein ACK4G3_00395 [bacterium]
MCQIKIRSDCLKTISHHTLQGFRKPYKEERAGFLFGRLNGKYLFISRSHFYRGGHRKRTWLTFPSDEIALKRGKELAKKLHLRFLGFYHSHPVVGKEKSWGPSDADRLWFYTDPHSTIFMVVGIYQNSSYHSHCVRYNRDKTLTYYSGDYVFRFNIHCKKHQGRCRLLIYSHARGFHSRDKQVRFCGRK